MLRHFPTALFFLIQFMAAAQTAHLQAARPVPTLREAYPQTQACKRAIFCQGTNTNKPT